MSARNEAAMAAPVAGPKAAAPRPSQAFDAVYLVVLLAFLDLATLGGFYGLSYFYAGSVSTTTAAAMNWRIADGVFCACVIYLLMVSGVYDRARLNNPYSQISRILVNAMIVTAMEWTVMAIAGATEGFQSAFVGPLNVVGIAVLIMCGWRLLCLRLLQSGPAQGIMVRNVAIVGADMHGQRLLDALEHRKDSTTRVIGVFDDRKDRLPPKVAGHDVRGTIEQLIEIARETQIDDVLVALPWGAESRLLNILDQLKVIPANVHLAPDVIGHHFLDSGFTKLDGVPLYNIYSRPISGWGALLKRAEDLILGSLILLMIFPVMLICALAVKLDSPGPILFQQRRFGYNNNLIGVYKFRSMYHHMRDENASRLATQNDPRITRIGAFLRKTSLDELPQLFNVLAGNMSLVGPRPHGVQAKAAGKLYQEVVREYAVRHRVKPGITGWAQVSGWRGETDTEEKIMNRVACDLYYMENWSIFLDIEILFRTVFAVVGKNVY